MVESGGPWIDYLTINLPVFGADAVSRLGVSDIIFFSLFVGCTLIWRLRRTLDGADAGAVVRGATMVVGVSLDIGVPALPLLSIFFLLANGDLLYHALPGRTGRGPPSRSGGRAQAVGKSSPAEKPCESFLFLYYDGHDRRQCLHAGV